MARNAAEQARVAVRNIRRDLNEGIRQQKKEGLSEDEAKRESDQVQAATDERIAEINEPACCQRKGDHGDIRVCRIATDSIISDGTVR